ncbi:MAG: sulfite exporter TauE/SafE family protein [Bacteroidales bacterium]|nr:sulfite exporter TauE/SafE family protein [Bacteroidales bacterium]
MIFHSAFEYNYLWLPLVGFIIGLLAAIIGGGGGFFFPPILMLFFKVDAQVAVATSLAATLPICVVGAIGHYRHKNIDVRMGAIFGAAGILGALLGASLTGLMTAETLKTTFGVYSILLAIVMVFNNYRDKRARAKGKEIPNGLTAGRISRGSFYGFIGGLITGTFGTSGTAPVLAGLFALGLPLKLVVGTSLMVIFINTVSALGAHFLVGQIDMTLVYFLAGGAMIGAFFGTRFLTNVRIIRTEGSIKFWYAIAIAFFGLIMILS